MGYFDRGASAPAVPVPCDLRLWDNGLGRFTLAWRRPIGRCDGYVVLGGEHPDVLAEVARVAATAACWPVAADGGLWLAVACLRGEAVGEPSAPIAFSGSAPRDSGWPLPARQDARDTGEAAPSVATSGPSGPPQLDPNIGLSCSCCAKPNPLATDDGALACPQTGEQYALLATGALVRVAELPFGLCRCCESRQPLIRSGATIVCIGRPGQAYRAEGTRYLPLPPELSPAALLADADAIDAALRANSALLGVNGVFVQAGHWSER
jgi:hypothetical protein